MPPESTYILEVLCFVGALAVIAGLISLLPHPAPAVEQLRSSGNLKPLARMDFPRSIHPFNTTTVVNIGFSYSLRKDWSPQDNEMMKAERRKTIADLNADDMAQLAGRYAAFLSEYDTKALYSEGGCD